MGFGNCSYREFSPLDTLETAWGMMGFTMASVLLAIGFASSMLEFDHMVCPYVAEMGSGES